MDIKNLTPNDVLNKIYNTMSEEDRKKTTFIILGKTGPTGKTWLWNELRKRGLNAVEVTEGLLGLVHYTDNVNHYITEILDNTVIIVLNRYVRRKYGRNEIM